MIHRQVQLAVQPHFAGARGGNQPDFRPERRHCGDGQLDVAGGLSSAIRNAGSSITVPPGTVRPTAPRRCRQIEQYSGGGCLLPVKAVCHGGNHRHRSGQRRNERSDTAQKQTASINRRLSMGQADLYKLPAPPWQVQPLADSQTPSRHIVATGYAKRAASYLPTLPHSRAVTGNWTTLSLF